jgi:hypothetical protein
MAAYTYDLPASDEQLKAVGMVAAEFSYLESIVETAIWALDEDTGREISTDRMRARLKILRKLYRQRWPDDEAGAKKLDKLCEEIRSAGDKRNLIHALWVRGELGSPKIATVIERGSVVKENRGQKPWQIEAVAALIADRSRALQKFLHDTGVVSPVRE